MDKNDVNEVSRSVYVGTVDFFGVMIPGVIVSVTCIVGFFIPLAMVITDLSNTKMELIVMDTNSMLASLFFLIIFSYMFGYILRLSSPDKLDRKSAVKVIKEECAKSPQKPSHNNIQAWIKNDEWPFDPDNPMDKYPYFNFRGYLKKRGHDQLTEELVTWEVGSDGKQRSKTAVNKMKMSVRLYCPELSALIDSKEAHIRLMAGTWSAFKFAQWPIWITLIILTVAGLLPRWVESILPVQMLGHNYIVYIFININLLLVIFFCNQQIEKLFHYRRVSELFHIVQAAYFADQLRNDLFKQPVRKQKQLK